NVELCARHHRCTPFHGSVCEMWNTVVVHGRRINLRSPVSGSVSLLRASINVTTLTPCSPRRTTRPKAFHASNVNTFSRGLISDAPQTRCPARLPSHTDSNTITYLAYEFLRSRLERSRPRGGRFACV